MKIFTKIINTILAVIFITFISVLATFFLTVFMPENVKIALEIFKNLLQIP